MSTDIANDTRAPLPIRQLGDPVLRMQAREVSIDAISSPEIQNIIDDMIVSMQAAGGIGLAAPQIGVSQRIITIQIPARDKIIGYDPTPGTPLTILINPEIVKTSAETRFAPEGCLSLQTPDGGMYEGAIERPEKVTVKAYDRFGKEIIVDGNNILGRVLQHEIDHLNGRLFPDLIQDLRYLRIFYFVKRSDATLEQNSFLA
jgi:peptide deformylase